MPMINLIHEERQEVRRRERQIKVVVLATAGLGIFLFFTSGYFLFNSARYQVMASVLDAKKRRLSPLLTQLKDNEVNQRAMEPKLTSLSSATKATEQWFRIFDRLAVSVPKGVWLTSVKSTQGIGDDTGLQIALNGYSITHETIGDLLLRLETCDDLENVALKFSQERIEDKQKVLEFEIDCYLAGSKQTKKVKEKDAA